MTGIAVRTKESSGEENEMRRLYVKRIRALACFGINYYCVTGQTAEDHLQWAAQQDRSALMLLENERTLKNGGEVCIEIPETEHSLFVIAYREHSELMTETVMLPAGKEDLRFEVETIYNGSRKLAIELRESPEPD